MRRAHPHVLTRIAPVTAERLDEQLEPLLHRAHRLDRRRTVVATIHDNPTPMVRRPSTFDDARIVRWFASNPSASHAKLRAYPIGAHDTHALAAFLRARRARGRPPPAPFGQRRRLLMCSGLKPYGGGKSYDRRPKMRVLKRGLEQASVGLGARE